MFKRMLIAMLAAYVSGAIMEYVNGIANVDRRTQAIDVLSSLKKWLADSSNKTKRALAELIPF